MPGRWAKATCKNIAFEAQRRATNLAEAARYAQEAQFMQAWMEPSEDIPPIADYVVVSGSISMVSAFKGGMQFAGAQRAVQVLSKAEGIEPLTWPGAGGSLIWVPACEEVIWCVGGNLGVSPGTFSGKITLGSFTSQAPSCEEMATFFTEAKVVEGGWWIGMGYVWTSEHSAMEMGIYSLQISTNAIYPFSKLTKCEPLNLEQTP